ncbi:hypothetical protein [Sphingobacterium endophyticum]|uniref:hypothetical protein n=1 Tax=Sphingobacterium endophyticum TaxID=2546448 RepID=UPI0012E28EF2|nr:hypothetical protein [Sphingobacterium endophyticum]
MTLSTARPLVSGRAPDDFWTSCGRDTSKTRAIHEENKIAVNHIIELISIK